MKRLVHTLGAFVACAFLFSLVAWSAEPPGDFYKDERWGYKLRVPKGWTSAAMSASEEWIASTHLSPKLLQPKKVGEEFVFSDRPKMWVIGFPHHRERGAKVEDKGGVDKITIKNPYRDYKDFLKREQWFVGGGYYFSKEETAEIDGAKVTQYEIKVEKMVDAPFRLVTWVFHADDLDIAVQFKILEDYFDDYQSLFTTCLKSFKRIARKTAMPGGTTTGEAITETEGEDKLSPEERKERRRKRVEDTLAREIEALPKGWISVRSEHYVALSHADEKFTKETLDFAECVRGYLDETFAVGNDYVPPGIIRIFANQQEESAFHSGTSWGGIEQISVARRTGEEKEWEYQYLGKRVTSQWLSFRNSLLSANMPYWLRVGLENHMSFARPKGKRIEFKPDPYDREQLREVVKSGKAIPLKSLLLGDDEKFKEHAHWVQAGSVVSWFLGEGNRGKCKACVQTYLATLLTAVEEEQKAYEAKRDAADKKLESDLEKSAEGDAAKAAEGKDDDDDEEDADEEAFEKNFEEWKKALREKEAAIKEKAFQAAFGKVTDSEWDKLNAAWQKFGG